MANKKNLVEEVDVLEEEPKAPEILRIRLCDRRPSGFIMDLGGTPAGSQGTEHYHEFDSPVARFIPNWGYRKAVKTEVRNGKKVDIEYHEKIRYIKEQTEISEDQQKVLGIFPSRASIEDKIEVKRGEFLVVNEGSFIGMFRFLKESFYNKSNPDRSKRATAIYEEVAIDKVEENINEYDLYLAEAVKFVAKYYHKGPKGYSYNEEKIDALCELFAVFAETPASKVTALNAVAKIDPESFVKKAVKFEQMAVTNILHALKLNVISIGGDGVVSYLGKDKIMTTLDPKLSRQDQIEKLANLLDTSEFKQAKDEFMLELEIAKEAQLKK